MNKIDIDRLSEQDKKNFVVYNLGEDIYDIPKVTKEDIKSLRSYLDGIDKSYFEEYLTYAREYINNTPNAFERAIRLSVNVLYQKDKKDKKRVPIPNIAFYKTGIDILKDLIGALEQDIIK